LTQTPPRLAWIAAIREPERALSWDLAQWQDVIREARRLRLAARLAEAVDAAGLMDRVPPQPARLLLAEQRASRHRTTVTTWAARRLAATLVIAPFPCVLLKGGAYLAQGLPIALGRLPSDLDILVPKADLPQAQALLRQAGWEEQQVDEHDRRYYYEWSHEVPPMRHEVHPIELDLHHDILPPLARTHVDIDLLLARLRPSIWPGWKVLGPADQVLHSAAHLFLDSEPRERIRDLVDIDGLLRHFGRVEYSFWNELPQRAAELGLAEPLALAVHFCLRWLDTPIPADSAARIAAQGPGLVRRAWLMPLFRAVLTPTDPDDLQHWRQRLAVQIVLVRYHLQRLPMRLLVPHLWRKFKARHEAVDPADAAAERR
jgi:hypothetical protein